MAKKNYRDSETGEYVSKEYAEENPATTVGERRAKTQREPKTRNLKRSKLEVGENNLTPVLEGLGVSVQELHYSRDNRVVGGVVSFQSALYDITHIKKRPKQEAYTLTIVPRDEKQAARQITFQKDDEVAQWA